MGSFPHGAGEPFAIPPEKSRAAIGRPSHQITGCVMATVSENVLFVRRLAGKIIPRLTVRA
jgi:hypothetical protein